MSAGFAGWDLADVEWLRQYANAALRLAIWLLLAVRIFCGGQYMANSNGPKTRENIKVEKLAKLIVDSAPRYLIQDCKGEAPFDTMIWLLELERQLDNGGLPYAFGDYADPGKGLWYLNYVNGHSAKMKAPPDYLPPGHKEPDERAIPIELQLCEAKDDLSQALNRIEWLKRKNAELEQRMIDLQAEVCRAHGDVNKLQQQIAAIAAERGELS